MVEFDEGWWGVVYVCYFFVMVIFVLFFSFVFGVSMIVLFGFML